MKNEVRHIVTDVVSIPVYKLASKTEAYTMATKPGWGLVEWYGAADNYKNPVGRDRKDKTQVLLCDKDCSAVLYQKNGDEFVIAPYEGIDSKEIPKQAECKAIIISDSCGYSFWAEDRIKIFITYDKNGLADTYRLDYGEAKLYDGEAEIVFEDLYKPEEGDWQNAYRECIPGTIEWVRTHTL